MSNGGYDPSKFDEIKILFDAAENFAKEIEMFHSDISIPANNELRYVGHHLLKVLTSRDETVFQEEFLKAKGHCQRSMYEASEAGLTYALGLIKEFQNDYRDLVVTDVVRDYADMKVRADHASEMLSKGRSNRASAEEQAEDYMATFRELRSIVENLQPSRSDLNAKKLALLKEDRRFTIWMTIAILVPISSAVVTALLKCL